MRQITGILIYILVLGSISSCAPRVELSAVPSPTTRALPATVSGPELSETPSPIRLAIHTAIQCDRDGFLLGTANRIDRFCLDGSSAPLIELDESSGSNRWLITSFDLSNDDAMLAISLEQSDESGEIAEARIIVVNLTSNTINEVYDNREDEIGAITWSRDGEFIALVRQASAGPDQIEILHWRTGKVSVVMSTQELAVGLIGGLEWSSDETSLLFNYYDIPAPSAGALTSISCSSSNICTSTDTEILLWADRGGQYNSLSWYQKDEISLIVNSFQVVENDQLHFYTEVRDIQGTLISKLDYSVEFPQYKMMPESGTIKPLNDGEVAHMAKRPDNSYVMIVMNVETLQVVAELPLPDRP